jgi:hypothetical protein
VTLADNYRLPVFRQEFHQRHPWEWTTLAENQWTHNERKLTAFRDCGQMALFTVALRVGSQQGEAHPPYGTGSGAMLFLCWCPPHAGHRLGLGKSR